MQKHTLQQLRLHSSPTPNAQQRPDINPQVATPLLRQAYDLYSFNVIPAIGQLVAGDAASYRYLVESIRQFPDQVCVYTCVLAFFPIVCIPLCPGQAHLSVPWPGVCAAPAAGCSSCHISCHCRGCREAVPGVRPPVCRMDLQLLLHFLHACAHTLVSVS